MKYPIELPFWLQGATEARLCWAEDDDEGGDEGDDGDEGDETDPKLGVGDRKAAKYSEEDVENLKKALAVERRRAKTLDRETRLTKKQKEDEELAKKGELEAATEKLTRSEQRVQALGAQFKKSAMDSALREEARRLNFIDPEDALTMVDRSEIEVDQDDDDPAKVDIDKESLKKAVKSLADRKKHLLKSGTEDDEPTGSSFGGGSSRTGKKKTAQQELMERYPSLQQG